MKLRDKLIGQIFTVTNKLHHFFGRIFKIIGFNVDKCGGRFVICEDIEEKGYKSSYIFYPNELVA